MRPPQLHVFTRRAPGARADAYPQGCAAGCHSGAGAANIVSGAYLARQAPEGRVPVERGATPTEETPEKAARTMKASDIMGMINLVCMAGVIGVTALLNMKAGTSSKWAAVTRFLP